MAPLLDSSETEIVSGTCSRTGQGYSRRKFLGHQSSLSHLSITVNLNLKSVNCKNPSVFLLRKQRVPA